MHLYTVPENKKEQWEILVPAKVEWQNWGIFLMASFRGIALKVGGFWEKKRKKQARKDVSQKWAFN